MISKSRLEAFSDNIFAVAATLLVLGLHVPQPGAGSVASQLLAQWPAYLTYIVSFMTIGIIWVNHHTLVGLLLRVDRTLLFLNLLLLMTVSLCSFSTAVLSQWILSGSQAHVVAAVYGAVFALMGVAASAIWVYAVLQDDMVPGYARRRRLLASSLRFGAGIVGYLVGIVLSFFSAPASLVVYAAVSAYYVSPVLPKPSIQPKLEDHPIAETKRSRSSLPPVPKLPES
jgi:uncharacterized membrane protein